MKFELLLLAFYIWKFTMKKFIKIVIILICTIVPSFFVVKADYDYMSCRSLFLSEFDDSQFINKNWNIFGYDNKVSTRDVIRNFCSNVSSFKCADSADWYNDYFVADQSVFLSILCNSVSQWDFYSGTLKILKKKNFFDFWIVKSTTGYEECNDNTSMDKCWLFESYVLPKIFNSIMNDLFDIRQSVFFWITELSDSFSEDVAANNFSKTSFLSIEDWICAKPDIDYYPKTCSKLKTYMKRARNLMTSTKVIDVSSLWETQWDCLNFRSENVLYCGTLSGGNTLQYSFVNAVYNEYFWYNLFTTYYSAYYELKNSDLKDGDSYLDDIYEMKEQVSKSKQAISISFTSLSDISYSFPLHIGFLMYQEDTQSFMKSISKVYPPMRTLYDKLQNVQDAQS